MEKIKIYTASFYQVRNLEPNMIPFSTAKGEPSWYHDNRDRSYTFVDKRGVYNGLVAKYFQFDESLVEKVECFKQCNLKPFECSFMKAYRKSIDKFDFDIIINDFITISNKLKGELKFEGDPIIILLVYEHPSCPCAERPVIQQYFKDHGYDVKEWTPDLVYKNELF